MPDNDQNRTPAPTITYDQEKRKLAEDKARTEAVLASIGDGVVATTDGGEIIFINEQAISMLGFSKEELMGKMVVHALKLVDEKGQEVPIPKQPIHSALFMSRKVVSREWLFVKKDGGRLSVSITATPVLVYGRTIGGVVVFRDITREREVDRMKTEFISLASHQLRTPLSAVKWHSEMLLSGDVGELTAEQKELMDNIYQSNERMIDLVNALLNISRIESGRIMINPVPTDLIGLVNEVLKDLKPKMEEKKHNLVISSHGELPKVNIDPKLIRNVYMNLLSNAIKYTQEGGEISVFISRKGDQIISQVTDTGYGIPKHQEDKVFSKFFRADNIVKKETEGSGLGLYLAKAIVESSGGNLWFESREDKGTTFWFSLPLVGIQAKEGEVTIDS